MAFEWKSPKDIWKGEGIYHLTFVVAGRRPLLGEVVAQHPDVTRPFYRNLIKRVPAVNDRGELAMVRLTPFGMAVSADLNALADRHRGAISICRKMILDDHLHVVLWVHKDIGKSILQVAHGFPPVGSEHERYYKPGGEYFDACSNGKLLLLEAYESSYSHPLLISRTESTLKRKAEERHQTYSPLPHDTKRWRMIAGTRCWGW